MLKPSKPFLEGDCLQREIVTLHSKGQRSNGTPLLSHEGLRVLVIRHMILGFDVYAKSLLRDLMALTKRGHSVTCIVAATYQSRADKLEIPNFTLSCLRLRRLVPIFSLLLFELSACWRVLRSIGRWDVVVVDPDSALALFPVLLVQRLSGRLPALILRVSTNPLGTRGYVRNLFESFRYTLSLKLSAIFFDRIFFISPMLAGLASAQLSIPNSKVSVWPSCVDTDLFDPSLKSGTLDLRKGLIRPGQLGVLYHGSIGRRRGTLGAVEAFKILNEQSVKATLILLGQGPARDMQWISSYIRANHMEEVVKVHGPIDYRGVPSYIAACDVGLVPLPDDPRWRYQCPTKTLEYLAMNKPVIVSQIPANSWIVGRAPVGVYLQGTSPQEIANGVQSFIANARNLDPQVGRRIAQDFSAEKIAEMLDREFRSIPHLRRNR